ncbi:MAG: 7-carboxy-7-deazaguanine synthase QueE [Ignavibacteria bacterium]|nr:7-carboxy-7-deazaguanine synthase QueE [Ignavibacteria bacterium]
MLISELFYSLQGEGKRTGFPSFFIRTNYCNLRCKFLGGNLCDSAYTSWDPKDKRNLGEMDISLIISKYKEYYPVDVVITGGEPTLQMKDLIVLCQKLKEIDSSIFITVETNGTIIGDYVQFIDLVSVSPKLKSSVPFGTKHEEKHNKDRLNIPVLKFLNKLYNEGKFDIQWKFVICNEKDVNEILELKDKVGFKNSNVFLMPEGVTAEEINQKRLMVVELCKKNFFNFSDRLHILCWGNQRGY